jgi:hypothetical protein
MGLNKPTPPPPEGAWSRTFQFFGVVLLQLIFLKIRMQKSLPLPFGWDWLQAPPSWEGYSLHGQEESLLAKRKISNRRVPPSGCTVLVAKPSGHTVLVAKPSGHTVLVVKPSGHTVLVAKPSGRTVLVAKVSRLCSLNGQEESLPAGRNKK